MSTKTIIGLDLIDKAERMTNDVLAEFPYDSIYLHSKDQLESLRAFLNGGRDQDNSILANFDLGKMAARELGQEEEQYADILHKLQRFVEGIS